MTQQIRLYPTYFLSFNLFFVRRLWGVRKFSVQFHSQAAYYLNHHPGVGKRCHSADRTSAFAASLDIFLDKTDG